MRAYLNTSVTGPRSGPAAQPPKARSQTGSTSVHEHALLSPALGDGSRGLALEVEDHEASVGAQGLAQVVIAVDADLRTLLGGEQAKVARPLDQRRLAGEEHSCVGGDRRRQRLQ